MDHIPHCGPHTIRVPYLGDEVWDGGDFFGYPERRGFRARTWPGGKILQVMQTWLFFGLFTEVMRLAEIKFDREEFIEQDGQGKYITTKALPTYSHALARYEENREPSSKSHRLATISSYLEKANEVVTFIAAVLPHAFDKASFQSTAGPVMLSVGLAGSWLATSCSAIYRDVGGPGRRLNLPKFTHGSGSFLEDKMLAEGWCPSLTDRLSTLGDRELQYVGYTHGSPDGERRDHSRCSTSLCSLSQIDEATYQVRHTSQGCGCETLEVDRTKMEAIIRAGATPVCRLIAVEAEASRPATESGKDGSPFNLTLRSPSHPGGRTDHFRLEVERASSERPYLAISHVWADGLGNPSANALPLCELILLQCRVSGAFVGNHFRTPQEQPSHLPTFDTAWSKWFWMDTLCVPVHPESKHLRKQVIKEMRHIYTAAESAMVLDRGLLRRRGPEDDVQMMIRILLSSWYSRLWTMQESLLAKKVMIVFSSPGENDGQNTMLMLDDWAKGFGSVTKDERALRGSTVASTCLALYQSLRKTGLLSMDNATAHILRAVPHRAVSKREDETICISTLLGLDLGKLLNVPSSSGNNNDSSNTTDLADQRMVTLLQMMGTIPFSGVFAPGPRLKQPGFRWALKSFLRQTGSEPVFHDSPTAEVTSDGLLCTSGGILLMSDVAEYNNFIVYEDGSDVPIAVGNLPHNREFEDPIPAKTTTTTSTSAADKKERELAVVLAAHISVGGPAILVEILDDSPATAAQSLVPRAGAEAGAEAGPPASSSTESVKRVRYLKLMGLTRISADPEFARIMSSKAESVTGGVVVGPQQKWLIT